MCHDVSEAVAIYAIAYDCIVVMAYACCHVSRLVISVALCSLNPSVVSASLKLSTAFGILLCRKPIVNITEFHLDSRLRPAQHLPILTLYFWSIGYEHRLH
jgi:hypothetical protein